MKYFPRPVLWLLVIAALAAPLAAVTGWQLWTAFGILVFAILANGLIATLEDDMPGGINNPDGNTTPKYLSILGWVVRCLGLLLGIGLLVLACLHSFSL